MATDTRPALRLVDATDTRDDARRVERDAAIVAAQPAETRRALAADLAAWRTWCSAEGRDPEHADADAVSFYVRHLAAEGYALATIRRRLSGVASLYRDGDSPTRAHVVRQTLRTVARERAQAGAEPQQARALLTDDVRRILAVCDDDANRTRGIRDRAMVLVGFAGALRRSELVGLDCDDVEISDRGAVLRIRTSKTSQTEAQEVSITRGRPGTCPVLALELWLALDTGEDAPRSGPVFRTLDRYGNVRPRALSGRSFSRRLGELADLAGIDAQRVSGHSLRAGHVTQRLASGEDHAVVAEQSRHRNVDTLRRYDRAAKRFRRDVARSLDL